MKMHSLEILAMQISSHLPFELRLLQSWKCIITQEIFFFNKHVIWEITRSHLKRGGPILFFWSSLIHYSGCMHEMTSLRDSLCNFPYFLWRHQIDLLWRHQWIKWEWVGGDFDFFSKVRNIKKVQFLSWSYNDFHGMMKSADRKRIFFSYEFLVEVTMSKNST